MLCCKWLLCLKSLVLLLSQYQISWDDMTTVCNRKDQILSTNQERETEWNREAGLSCIFLNVHTVTVTRRYCKGRQEGVGKMWKSESYCYMVKEEALSMQTNPITLYIVLYIPNKSSQVRRTRQRQGQSELTNYTHCYGNPTTPSSSSHAHHGGREGVVSNKNEVFSWL